MTLTNYRAPYFREDESRALHYGITLSLCAFLIALTSGDEEGKTAKDEQQVSRLVSFLVLSSSGWFGEIQDDPRSSAVIGQSLKSEKAH